MPSIGNFCVQCNGRVICGGGLRSIPKCVNTPSKNVYEWRSNQFMEIKSLNFGRSYASAVFYSPNIQNHDGILIVAGKSGFAGHTMEYLTMNDSFRHHDWRVCTDQLPLDLPSVQIYQDNFQDYHHINFYQINIFQNKLILINIIGGNKSRYNKVWEGDISFEQELRVKWSPLPPMLVSRPNCVSVVIDDKFFCIGGRYTKSTEYFSFRTNSWQKGPDLPFTLSDAKAVVNPSTSQCFILGGRRDGGYYTKVYLFDPENGLIGIQGELDIARCNSIAVLL